MVHPYEMSVDPKVEKLEAALREIAECEDVHTKLNQERLCCKFQSIAIRALNDTECDL